MSTKTNHVRQSFTLDPAGWEALDTIAARVGANAKAGKNAGKPGWRALIQQIARGEVVCERVEQSRTLD